ncbi:MAG: hypothetical protein CVV27_19525 [Candidatus Melainabacteria bacterium HGW-Melainabacteria-1]|nr:MAG: hypothetical protein CVV27_19525 [Candidatus Melainabacteria bacterium HGW-Melainabacteria-1]
MNHLIKDSRKVRSASTAVLMVYTVLMAYFFDAGVTHLAGISKQGGSVLPIWLAAVMAMAMFYFPFRIFFELANRRNIFGWIVFVVSISLVYLETMRRLTADI